MPSSSSLSNQTENRPAIPDKSGGRFAHAGRALRRRNFKLFVSAQSISLIGPWMTRRATSCLVYRLTHSALLLGIVGFAGQILTFLLAPFAGVWIEKERSEKHTSELQSREN